jgi:hypothetical protein
VTHPGANTVLALRVTDRDRQNSIRDIVNLCLPIPPRDRRSKNRRGFDAPVGDRLALNRVRVHRRGGPFPRRREGKGHRLSDTVAIHQIGELDLDVDAVRARGAAVNSDPGIVSWGEFGEGRRRRNPVRERDEGLEIVRLQGDRLDAPKVRGQVVIEERVTRGSQGIVLEGVEQIPDDGVRLVGTSDSIGSRAGTAVCGRGVHVRVDQPNGVVIGEVLERQKASSRNTPHTPLSWATVREGQEILVGPISVLNERETVIEDRVVSTQSRRTVCRVGGRRR